VPYKSPSNEQMLITRTVNGETEIWLGPEHISSLQDEGVVSAVNWAQTGFRLGGSRTGAYPGSTDPKDTWIPIRWMFNWIENKIVLTSYVNFLDLPIVRRKVDLVLNSINDFLNGLPQDALYAGGRLEFLETENTESDLLNGKCKWHLYIAPPPPMSEMEVVVEYDVSLISPALFG